MIKNQIIDHNMRKTVKLIYLASILILLKIDCFSQYYIKYMGDSISFEVDSTILSIDNFAGQIHWEVSKDSLTWEFVNNPNDTLVVRIDSTAFYRAVLTVDNCNPVNSDVAKVGFKSIIAEDKVIEIDPSGGVFFMPSGIKIIVPPGAVIEKTLLSVEKLDEAGSDSVMPFLANTGKIFCAGIYCEPAGTEFYKPIKINVPVENYIHTDLPRVYLYHSPSQSWNRYTGNLLCSEEEKYMEYSFTMLQSARILLEKDLLGSVVSGNKSKSEETDCKEDEIEIITKSFDYAGTYNAGCYVVSDIIKVKFLDCDGKPEASASGREIGNDCNPQIRSSFSRICLRKGESEDLTITATIGGIPLKGMYIVMGSLNEGLSVSPSSDNTDGLGCATFKVTCNVDNVDGTIKYDVVGNYYLLEVLAEGEDEWGVTRKEFIQRYKKSLNYQGSVTIKCYEQKLTWVELLGANMRMLKGETKQLTIRFWDQMNQQMDLNEPVEFIVNSYPSQGVITIDEKNIVSAVKPGVAEVKVKVAGFESNTIPFSVAYEGSIIPDSKVMDHNYWWWCGCEYDYINPPYNWTWYIVSYSASYHIKFWLDEKDKEPNGELTGREIIDYQIESNRCRDATFVIPVYSKVLYTYPGTTTTQEIIDGNQFHIGFDYIGLGEDFYGHCKMINPEEVEISVAFMPDGCIGYIECSGILK